VQNVSVERLSVASAWIVYGGRLCVAVPNTFDVLPDSRFHGGVDHVYKVTVDIENGRLVCTKLVIDQAANGPPVNTDALRRADIVDWMTNTFVTQNLVFDCAERSTGEMELTHHSKPKPGFNSDGMTETALDTFAQHYAYLMVTGQRPSGVFLRDYEMSRPTVTRWLNAAKERGILIDEHERIEREWADPD
jgi:hypothetical protein